MGFMALTGAGSRILRRILLAFAVYACILRDRGTS